MIVGENKADEIHAASVAVPTTAGGNRTIQFASASTNGGRTCKGRWMGKEKLTEAISFYFRTGNSNSVSAAPR